MTNTQLSPLRTAAAVFLCSAAALAHVQASAQTPAPAPRSELNMSLALANQLVSDTVKACTEAGYVVSAVVVDRAGVMKAMQRADNAGTHTVQAAERKAFTSASAKAPTLQMMENAQKNPGAANLTDIPGFLLLGGGVPVKSGDQVIGAIGVAGAPGGHLDDQCANKALEAFAAGK
ncbi:GlcG/HbpS family heme-binding protein [Lampropedia aestuarii]|uniref:GlcG/HbpS family heme-binding protein n=1 Tax=Lampropedia aestuarii TaxID=2562762 RepID=UPI0024691DA9|nr:heme-binding protein [Lampropedia aestuarii]MDH5858929.1 heme-binding protein [Lampropedia aestuarii]